MDVIKIFKSKWIRQAGAMAMNPKRTKELLRKVLSMFTREGLEEVRSDLKCLYDYVHDIATGRYKGFDTASLVMATAALVYLVTPIDCVSDLLPGGFIDDAAVIAWTIKQLHEELLRYRHLTRRTNSEGETLEANGETPEANAEAPEGETLEAEGKTSGQLLLPSSI